jgi:formate dehydrogenase subunit gamma
MHDSLVQQVIEAHGEKEGALLPVLHAVQAALGYIPADTVPAIAKALRLSRAEVHGVLSFYHDFRPEPGGRHTLQVCRAEACQAVGARELEAHVLATLGIDYGQTTPDGALTLEPVYCLGNCACGPAIRFDDTVLGRVGNATIDALLDDLAREENA